MLKILDLEEVRDIDGEDFGVAFFGVEETRGEDGVVFGEAGFDVGRKAGEEGLEEVMGAVWAEVGLERAGDGGLDVTGDTIQECKLISLKILFALVHNAEHTFRRLASGHAGN